MYGYVCPDCGAHLDPGEKCDCQEEKEAVHKDADEHESYVPISSLVVVERNGQLRLAF